MQRIFLTSQPFHTVTFAGVGATNGSTGISLETAKVLAAAVKQDVLLIDAEPSASDAPSIFRDNGHGPGAEKGLSTAMASGEPIRQHASKIGESSLFVMRAGPYSGRVLLAGAMRAFLERARKEFSYVLIHSPALAVSPDCVALGQAADGLVLVIEADKTRKGVAMRTMHELEAAGTTILGAVLSKTMQPIPAFLYGRL